MGAATSAEPLCALYDAGLFDLDGVVYRGNDPVPFAAQSIAAARRLGMKPVFVTNNASRTPATVAAQLNSLGIEASAQDILGSAHVGVELAEAELGQGARVLLCGGAGLREAAENSGLVVVETAEESPDAVIHGFAPETDWRMLSEAVMAINAGARYIATNLDRLIPRERGLMMGMGSLAKAVEHATGVAPISGAKPDARMFRSAARKAGASRALVVGDNLDTDILGATNSGLASLHVLTGAHNATDAIMAAPDRRPRYLAFDLQALAAAYPPIRIGTGHARRTLQPHEERIDHGEIAAFLRSTLAEGVAGHTGLVEPLEAETLDASGNALAHVSLDATGLRADGTLKLPFAVQERKIIDFDLTEAQYRAAVHLLWAFMDMWPQYRAAFSAIAQKGQAS